jgi:hypothetical protein
MPSASSLDKPLPAVVTSVAGSVAAPVGRVLDPLGVATGMGSASQFLTISIVILLTCMASSCKGDFSQHAKKRHRMLECCSVRYLTRPSLPPPPAASAASTQDARLALDYADWAAGHVATGIVTGFPPGMRGLE